jgi:ABC-2 type transport system ATP-binding protein
MPRRITVAAVAALIALAAGCSSSSGKHSATPTSGAASTPSTTSTSAPATSKCAPPAVPAPQVTPVPGTPSDRTLTGVDDARIRLHWFPLANPPAKGAPTVLMGPGWGSGGSTDTQSAGSHGNVTIKDLRDAGYNVMTWDPRGFGASTGTIEIDNAQFEARDVERIIEWIATQPGVELDAPHDPRVGMVGASYGGGIQLSTAAIDCRVDAIVPSWAWNSLRTSLFKADTPKTGWATFLYGVAAGRQLDPHIRSAEASSLATGTISAADRQWFIDRGPGDLVARIHAPTLLVQGTIDTLFTLDEAVQNEAILASHGVPTAMIWACVGHGVCLTDPGDLDRIEQRTLSWLARYLKGDTSVDTGPAFEFVDQNGTDYESGTQPYPLAPGTPITGSGSGTLQLVASGGAGAVHVPAGNHEALGGLVGPITPAKAANAVNVTISTGPKASVIAGAPTLKLTYHGTASGTRPERVFAQLVDPATGLVLGNQITPIAVTLDGKTHTTTVPLEIVTFTTKPGGSLLLQIVATTVAYAQPRLGGSVSLQASLTLPTTQLSARG